MFYLVTAANVGKMMNYCSDKIDIKFQLGGAVSVLMLLLLYSSSFDVPRRFMSDVELNLLPLAFIFNGEILSSTERGYRCFHMDTRQYKIF